MYTIKNYLSVLNKIYLSIVFISLISILGSCASMVRDGSTEFELISNTEDLIIEIVDKKHDTIIHQSYAPSFAVLPKSTSDFFEKADYEIRAYTEGSNPLVYRLVSDDFIWQDYIIGNSFLNLISLGILGTAGFLFVDPLSGAMFDWKYLLKQDGLGTMTLDIQSDPNNKQGTKRYIINIDYTPSQKNQQVSDTKKKNQFPLLSESDLPGDI